MPRRFLSHITPAALIAAAFAAPSAIAHDAGGLRYADMPADAYAVLAQVRAKPGNNLLYFLQESREAPGHFIFYEIFASQADFEAHNQTPHVQSWFARLPELADGGVTVIRMGILNNAATDR
jgi:quinol monooxygenase YgiN